MQKKYGKKGFVILALTDESTSKVKPYVSKHGMTYIVGTEAGDTIKEYGIKFYPTAFIVGADGKIVWKGNPSKAECEEAIKKALKNVSPKAGNVLQENAAKTEYEKARKLQKKKKYAKAFKAYEQIVKNHKSTKYGKKAKSRLKKMKANKKIMAKIDAADMRKKCESWLDTARMMAKNDMPEKAIEYYERIIKKYPDSEYAKTAQDEMDELG